MCVRRRDKNNSLLFGKTTSTTNKPSEAQDVNKNQQEICTKQKRTTKNKIKKKTIKNKETFQ